MAARKPCVFIHTNERQLLGALVSEYSLKRNSAHPELFDVRFLKTEEHAFLRERDGQPFLRDGQTATWQYENLQSFTPLRFMPPEAMGYEGRALLIDPDVFAVRDVWELLGRDMAGHAILCRARGKSKGKAGCMATSVMLLDCARLSHWRCEEDFGALFDFKRDYADWICLRLEPEGSVGLFEDEWNDFDHLTEHTKLLHNTKRQTQPWKTGLPVDFTTATKRVKLLKPGSWLRPLKRSKQQRFFVPHPDPQQERFFFGLLRECLEQGVVSEDLLREEMRRDHLRHDAFEVLERLAPTAA